MRCATFWIDKLCLGVDVRSVREINRALEIQYVQQAPDHILGLLNLRGQIITIFDLACRLGFPKRDLEKECYNIILKTDDVGLVVDSIGEVVDVEDGSIEGLPANIQSLDPSYVRGVFKMSEQLLIILDHQELVAIEQDDEEETLRR